MFDALRPHAMFVQTALFMKSNAISSIVHAASSLYDSFRFHTLYCPAHKNTLYNMGATSRHDLDKNIIRIPPKPSSHYPRALRGPQRNKLDHFESLVLRKNTQPLVYVLCLLSFVLVNTLKAKRLTPPTMADAPIMRPFFNPSLLRRLVEVLLLDEIDDADRFGAKCRSKFLSKDKSDVLRTSSNSSL